MNDFTAEIKQKANELGFEKIGIAKVGSGINGLDRQKEKRTRKYL